MDILLCVHNKITPLCICTVELALNSIVVIMPWFELVGVVLHLLKANVFPTTTKAKAFYFDALLPELASPRHGKGGMRQSSIIY